MSPRNRHVLLTATALTLVALAASDPAYAQSVLGKADTFLQKVVDALTGTTGKLVATIAVVASGLAPERPTTDRACPGASKQRLAPSLARES
jgi:type IV secretory pathway VirB2 component (pilin)